MLNRIKQILTGSHRKWTVTIALTVIMVAGVHAQNTFFTSKAGTVLIYANYNAKGKAESHSQLTIKGVEGSGSNMTISYLMESLDKNRKSLNPPMEIPCTVVIKDDVLYLDMNQMFAGQMKDQQLKMEITGVPVELPGNMEPGQSLKDAEMTMTLDMGIMKMKTVIKMTDGKCLAIEDVTVPAGTFKCHKITQTVTTTVIRKDVMSRTISWYAPNIGTVKTETYDAKNNLSGSMELVEMK